MRKPRGRRRTFAMNHRLPIVRAAPPMRPPMVAPATTGEEIVDAIDAGAGAGVGVGDDTRIPHAYLLRAVI